MQCLVSSTIRDAETPPIFPHSIRPGHDHPVLCDVLDVSHSGGDVLVCECERVDAVLEEVALLIDSDSAPILVYMETDEPMMEQMLTC